VIIFRHCNQLFVLNQCPRLISTILFQRVSSTECSLSFSSQEVPDAVSSMVPAAVDAPHFELVDISDLISRCGFDASSLLSMSVCPALTLYRETIGVQESLIGAFDLQDFTATFPAASRPYSPPTETNTDTESPAQLASASSTYISSSDFDYIDDDGDDNDNDADDFEIDGFADFAPVQSPPPGRKSVGTALNRRSSILGNGTVHKIQWDSEPDRIQDPGTPLKARGDSLSGSALTSASAAPLVWDATGISCANEYSFFDIDMINKSNNWAGARHWKYATRRQAALAVDPALEVPDKHLGSADGVADKAVASKTVASRAKSVKKKFTLNPLSEPPSEDLFAVPKSRSRGSDVTCLTAAAIEKEVAFEAEGGLFLPPDAKLQTRDLCRLMLCHNIIVPPPLLAHVFMKQAATSKASTGKSHDVIWGQVRRDPTATSTGGFNPVMESDDFDDRDDDDNDGGTYGEDFCDPDGDNTDDVDIVESIADGMERGLHISSEGLLRATRTVDKIDIGWVVL
jgi:Condensin complex subunit 2